MSDFFPMTCPFCGEKEFDDIGLKHHLLRGWCAQFNLVDAPDLVESSAAEESRKETK
jgi:hypothetical protein